MILFAGTVVIVAIKNKNDIIFATVVIVAINNKNYSQFAKCILMNKYIKTYTKLYISFYLYINIQIVGKYNTVFAH